MRIRGSFALTAGALLALPLAIQATRVEAEAAALTTTTQNPNAVVCDGTGLMIENGLWGVAGAKLQSRVELAAGGPNLVCVGQCSMGARDKQTSISSNEHESANRF